MITHEERMYLHTLLQLQHVQKLVVQYGKELLWIYIHDELRTGVRDIGIYSTHQHGRSPRIREIQREDSDAYCCIKRAQLELLAVNNPDTCREERIYKVASYLRGYFPFVYYDD